MRALVVLLALACGGSQTPVHAPLFDEAELSAAREHAPDLVAAAEQAAGAAERADSAGDAAAADDHRTRARLLFEAAVVEAERIAIERERIEAETETETATQATVALEVERAEIATRTARDRAALVAREQAAVALQRAEEDEPRRHRGRATELAAARREAATALAARTLLVAAAARALGAPDTDAQEIASAADAAKANPDPEAAMRAADAAHRRALTLLGRARAALPVTTESRDAFVSAATERRFQVEVREAGLVLHGLGDRLERGRMTAIAELALAHPHGPVQLRGPTRVTTALTATLRDAGVAAERIQTGDAAAVEVLFPAYGR